MRLAYVTETYPPEINGVAMTVERCVRYLRSSGHRVSLVRPERPDAPACQRNDEWRTAACPLPMYPDLRLGLALPAALQNYFRAARTQLVHVATPGPLGWAAVRAAAAAKLPCTSDFRTNFHRYARHYRLATFEPLVGRYLRWLHNQTQCTFAPAEETAAELRSQGYAHVEVVGRGVDAKLFSPCLRNEALRRQWSPQGAPVLLYAGRLAPEKSVDLALDAYEHLRRRLPGARMVVVGDGPQRHVLEAAHPTVRFTGALRGAALAEHYASADLFLFPSLSDTFGNVTLEALACGLPVIAFRTAAAALHVESGRSGLLVPPHDRSAFIGATLVLGSDPALLARARRHARRAGLRAGWDGVLGLFEQHLETALRRPVPAAHVALAG